MKIEKITIQNYRGFPADKEYHLNIDGKNLLLYGENGSGKTSIYKALVDFFNRVLSKNLLSHNKNIFTSGPSKIEIKFDSIPIPIVWDDTPFPVEQRTQIWDIACRFRYFDYRGMLKTHFIHAEGHPNLYNILINGILADMPVLQANGVQTTIGRVRQELLATTVHKPSRHTFKAKDKIENARKIFNTILQNVIKTVTTKGNEVLNELQCELKFELEPRQVTYNPGRRGFENKIIDLKVKFNNQDLTEPQHLLNEARLSLLAFAIFIGARRASIPSAPLPGQAAPSKIIAIDDLLISLDMSNRDIILDFMLKEFDDSQILFLTHDKLFFEMMRRKIKGLNKSELWITKEMYSKEENGIVYPVIFNAKSHLEAAEIHFLKNDYDVAGNFLRKATEERCKEILPRRRHFNSDFSLGDLCSLLSQCISFFEENELDAQLFKRLDEHRTFVLNPASHANYDVPRFKTEVQKCLQTLKELKKIEISSPFKIGDTLMMPFVCAKCNKNCKIEISIQDDFKFLKLPTGEQRLMNGMFNYRLTIDGKECKWKPCDNSIENVYKRINEKANNALSGNYLEDLISSENSTRLKNILHW